MRYSLEGKVVLLSCVIAALGIALASGLAICLEAPVLSGFIALTISVPLAVVCARQLMRSSIRTIAALRDAIGSIKEGDFSIAVSAVSHDELGDLVRGYNGLGDALRAERQSLYQRELLLDTVIQETSLALVLTDAGGRVVYCNNAARQLFVEGRRLEGASFADLLVRAPAALRAAVESGNDTLFTVENAGEQDAYYLSQRQFRLNGQPHALYLLKQLTREVNRQEVQTWKKVIRVIAHELNNSLAPISSLAHSGRQIAASPQSAQLQRIFSTIEGRAKHLHGFIDGYARFAKLPQPQRRVVEWQPFLSVLQHAMPYRLLGVPPRYGMFDPAQIEQALINLLKNAREASAEDAEVEIEVVERAGTVQVTVLDRGCGMTHEVLRNALMPFYSTKSAGAGLGLTICREVIEAHGGRMSLANREGGGLAVTLWLPVERSQVA